MSQKFFSSELFESRIIKFLGVGVLNTVFGYTIYAALVFVNIPYLIALLAATVAGVIFNYFSFGRMVFHGHGGWFVFGKFVVAYVLIYGVNAAFLRVLTRDFHLNPYVGQVICTPLSVLLSWLLMTYWVYKKD